MGHGARGDGSVIFSMTWPQIDVLYSRCPHLLGGVCLRLVTLHVRYILGVLFHSRGFRQGHFAVRSWPFVAQTNETCLRAVTPE